MTTYSGGDTITITADTTLYALWQIITYTLSYDANGGTGAPSSQTLSHGVAGTISSTAPTRASYTFLGWSTSSTATTATYAAGGSITITADTTLYAVWKLATVMITYNANGGSGAPSAATVDAGASSTLSTTAPTRSGYRFLGWASSSTATSAAYASGGSITTSADITLYAVWTLLITVTFDANGGSGAPSAVTGTSSTTTTAGYDVTMPDTVPTRAGYVFLYWSNIQR